MLQSLGNHNWAEVRSTNTNVNNGVDFLSRVTLPCSGANRVRKLFDVSENFGDFCDTFLGDVEGTFGIAKSEMEYSTIF
jgi:hypothetical protein